ncbi:MAG: hypothetical protein ACO1N3_00215 [Gammaproteobacteria bacterium]
MQNIYDILYLPNIPDMFPKIQAYYERYLGLQVKPQTLIIYSESPDEPNEMSLVYPCRIINANKLSLHDMKAAKNDAPLDSGELFQILSAHFSDVLSKKKLSLNQLIDLKRHIDTLQSKHLRHTFLDEHPECSVVARFAEGIYFSILQEIKHTINTNLSNPNYKNSLLSPLTTCLDELNVITPHCNIPDLIDFQESLDSLRDNQNIPPEQLEELELKLQTSSINLTKETKKRLSNLLASLESASSEDRVHTSQENQFLAKKSVVNEFLPTLKSQIYIKKNLHKLAPKYDPNIEKLLDHTIKSNIFDLLDLYEQDVKKSISDLKKSQKLQMIEHLKILCDEDTDSDLLYQEIAKNGDLLKSNSFGRYLFETICWLLGIKITTEKYSATLFQAANFKPSDEPLASDSTEPKNKYL